VFFGGRNAFAFGKGAFAMPGGIDRRAFLKTSLLAAGALTAHGQIVAESTAPGSKGVAGTQYEFLDPRIVEHTYFLERTASEVQRPLPGPILRDSDVATVLPKPEGGLSMWHLRLVPRPGAQDFNFVLGYAESDDGIGWHRPELGLKEIDGNKRNNVLILPNDHDAKGRPLTGFFGTGMFCVLDAKLTPHPKARARYTALYLTNVPSNGGLHLAYSEDGLRWLAYPENPVYRGWPDTANNFFYDRRLGRYVLYLRPSQNLHAGPPDVNRLVSRAESDDLVHWHGERVVLDTDAHDAPAAGTVKDGGPGGCYPRGRDRQFYGLNVKPYGDLYLGLAPVLDTISGADWVEMLHSVDGIEWQREPERKPFLLGVEGQWDSPSIYFTAASAPVPVKDKLLFYYGGTNMPHLANGKAFLGWLEGLRTHTPTPYVRGVGLATVPRGRLVGYVAKQVPGELLTRPFPLSGPELTLNADAAKGEVKAGLVDEGGAPIGGLTLQDAQPIRCNGLDLPLQWKGKRTLNHLVGQTVRLRITATNAALYGLGVADGRKG
jgi:hypothetical protein